MAVIQKKEVIYENGTNKVVSVDAGDSSVNIFTYGTGSATFQVSIDGVTWTDRFLVNMKTGIPNATVTEEGNYLTVISAVKYMRFDNVSGFTKIEFTTY